MKNDDKMELTEGSEYKISSLGTKDNLIETEGVFKGFISVGLDGTGLLIELNEKHGDMQGKTRIVPLHAILLIDVLSAKENHEKDDDKGMSHYVG
jgi:hypothetical protein